MQLKYMLLFSAILCSLNLFSQEKRGMTPLDVAKLEYVGSGALAEDGSKAIYTLRSQADPLKENKSATYSLHVYDLNERTSTALVTEGSVGDISFRPGHSTVTYLSKLEGDEGTSLYEIPVGGGTAQKILSYETSISAYSWSPDGSKLIFLANKPKAKVENALPYSPELYEMEPTYKRAFLATPGEGEPKEFMMEGNFTDLAWNPDGKRVAFSATPTPFVDDLLMAQHILIVNTSTMNLAGEVDHSGKLGDFCWSPDGAEIAFIGGADKHDPVAGRLFVAPATGGKPLRLEAEFKGKFESIEWIDPNYISFLASTGTESVKGLASPNAEKYPVVIGEFEGLSVNSFDANVEGRAIYTIDSWEHPTELFVMMGKGKKLERLTNSNPWLDEIALGKQEVIRYNARDGMEIEGMVIYPLNYSKDERYPMITVVHGGPEAHYDNGWLTAYSMAGQVGAAKGYAVFYPNYRGSTGRGLEFTLSSQADPAGKEFDDIVDGVDYLVEKGLADEKKVGVTGGSYGGYATGWLATRYTEKFAAGVMFVGISNKVSKWGTTDIPNEEYLVHARKWVYEDYDFFLKRSPVYYADQCKTPLLIMHGKEDTRVHPGQSMELYRHIKTRTNTPVELVFYPGEGHGNAKSTARYDYNLRMLDWFDKYLMKEKSRS